MPYLSCGDCIACRNGKRNCCVDLEVMGVHVDGAMAEYAAIPLENLVLARTLTLTQMALVENQSIGAHAVRRAEVRPGEKLLVGKAMKDPLSQWDISASAWRKQVEELVATAEELDPDGELRRPNN